MKISIFLGTRVTIRLQGSSGFDSVGLASHGNLRGQIENAGRVNKRIGYPMAEETKSDRVKLEELMVSTLAMTDALVKLMIAKGRHHRGGVQSPVEH